MLFLSSFASIRLSQQLQMENFEVRELKRTENSPMPRSPVGSLATVTTRWNSFVRASRQRHAGGPRQDSPALSPPGAPGLLRGAAGIAGSQGRSASRPRLARSLLCSWLRRANYIWAAFQVAGLFQKGALKGWAPLALHQRKELGFARRPGRLTHACCLCGARLRL